MAICYEAEYVNCISEDDDLFDRLSALNARALIDQPSLVTAFSVAVNEEKEKPTHGKHRNTSAPGSTNQKSKSNFKFKLNFFKKKTNVENSKSQPKVAPVRKNQINPGKAAMAAWQKEEAAFQQNQKTKPKPQIGPRGVLSQDAFTAMRNAAVFDQKVKKPKIRKKEKPELTEKILTVLKAAGEGKLNNIFNESEVSLIARHQKERNRLLLNLRKQEQTRWWKRIFNRFVTKKSYYHCEFRNLKILQTKSVDFDAIYDSIVNCCDGKFCEATKEDESSIVELLLKCDIEPDNYDADVDEDLSSGAASVLSLSYLFDYDSDEETSVEEYTENNASKRSKSKTKKRNCRRKKKTKRKQFIGLRNRSSSSKKQRKKKSASYRTSSALSGGSKRKNSPFEFDDKAKRKFYVDADRDDSEDDSLQMYDKSAEVEDTESESMPKAKDKKSFSFLRYNNFFMDDDDDELMERREMKGSHVSEKQPHEKEESEESEESEEQETSDDSDEEQEDKPKSKAIQKKGKESSEADKLNWKSLGREASNDSESDSKEQLPLQHNDDEKQKDADKVDAEASGDEEERDFNIASCDPTESKESGIYTKAANASLSREQYLMIFEKANSNKHFKGVHPVKHPLGGYIYVYDLNEVQNHKSLNTKNAIKEITKDGYSWYANDGRKEVTRKDRDVKRNQWRAQNDKKVAVEFRKWCIDCPQYPNLRILHYFGDASQAAKGVLHGNSKYTEKPFIPACPSTLAKERTQTKTDIPSRVYSRMQNEKTDGPNELYRPSNLNQVQNSAKQGRIQARCTPSSSYNTILQSAYCIYNNAERLNEKHFIQDGCLFDSNFFIAMHVSNIIKEIEEVAKITGMRQYFYYDTSFNFGDFSLTPLSWHHPLYKRMILIGALIHRSRAQKIHKKYLKTFFELHKKRLRNIQATFITDEEFNLERIWPNATHLLCSLHLLRNMVTALEKLGISSDRINEMVEKFRSLRDCQSFDEFDALMDSFAIEKFTNPAEKKIFCQYIVKLRDTSSAAAYLNNQSVDKVFITALEESLTSNGGESVNGLIGRHTEKDELQLDEIIYALYYIGGLQYNDILRGYYNDGSYELIKEFKKHLKGQKFDLPESELMSLPSMEEFNHFILEQEGPIMTGKLNEGIRKALVSTVMDSFKITEVHGNLFTVEDSIQKRPEAVSFSEKGAANCSCRRKATCLHILSVLKLKGKEMTVNKEVGDSVKDEKRLRDKKLGLYGRKKRQRKEKPEMKSSSSEEGKRQKSQKDKSNGTTEPTDSVLITSPVKMDKEIRNILDEAEIEKNNGITSLRLFLNEWVPDFYSPHRRPVKTLDLLDENEWFHRANLPSTTCIISSNIYQGDFFEPLPVLPVGKALFSTTSDNILLLIFKSKESAITAVAVGSNFSNNGIDECYMHAGMVGRDDGNKIAVSLYICESAENLKEKLLHLTGFNNDITNSLSSKFVKRTIRSVPSVINEAYLDDFVTTDGNIIQPRKKNVELYCCCNRSHFTLSEERNQKLKMLDNTLIQCNTCQKWYFWKCVGINKRIYGKWFCYDCVKPPLLVRHSTRDRSSFTNSCPLDGFLSAAMVFDQRFPNSIRSTIEGYDAKNAFEDGIVQFLSSDLTTADEITTEKITMLERLVELGKLTRNLEGTEETVVARQFKERWYTSATFTCQLCNANGTTDPDDNLLIRRFDGSIAETITAALQPENADLWKYCCQSRCIITDIHYGASEPWVLPLRMQSLGLLRQITPELIEQFPLEVEVTNDGKVLNYKLGLISFATPGHFIGIIPFSSGYIFYDGLHMPLLMPLRRAVESATAEDGIINIIYYFLDKTSKKKNDK